MRVTEPAFILRAAPGRINPIVAPNPGYDPPAREPPLKEVALMAEPCGRSPRFASALTGLILVVAFGSLAQAAEPS
jgi:hypothetical protein